MFQAPRLIRYADDFVIMCEELDIIKECQILVESWLTEIGLELKPSKTRIAHTLEELEEEEPGFNFLGFNIRQFKVGKHKSGKSSRKKPLGFKTIIRPTKESVKKHYESINKICDERKAVDAASLIRDINPIIRGWCNYQSPWHSKETFSKMKDLMWKRLWRWAKRRHPKKNSHWIKNKYFGRSRGWYFESRKGENPLKLLCHADFPASVKWVKVEGTRSPYDGDEIYWSTRMGDKYKIDEPQKARLLKRQKGKCGHCGLRFKPDDILEKHHLNHKAKGGSNADNNLIIVHLHCHDQLHGSKVDATN